MSEIIIKIGDDQAPDGYKDGDVIHAFNKRRIRQVHAEHICHLNHVIKNSDGLNPLDSLAYDWHNSTRQYRFERISEKEVRRTDLFTGAVTVLSDIPNKIGEFMHVEDYLDRQKKHPSHKIFGTNKNEVWFGGLEDTSDNKLSAVWVKIEEKTPNREVDFQLWPLGNEDKKQFLAISVNDFDDTTAADYEAPLEEDVVDTDGKTYKKILRKRNHKVNWRGLLPHKTISVADVLDFSKSVDMRGDLFNRADIVSKKP